MLLPCMPAVLCPEPESTPNGKYRYLTQTTTPVVGSQLEYTCQSTHTLVGERVLTCLNTGEWSSDTPTCAGKWRILSTILCSVLCQMYGMKHYYHIVKIRSCRKNVFVQNCCCRTFWWFCSEAALSHLGQNILRCGNFDNLAEWQ